MVSTDTLFSRRNYGCSFPLLGRVTGYYRPLLASCHQSQKQRNIDSSHTHVHNICELVAFHNPSSISQSIKQANKKTKKQANKQPTYPRSHKMPKESVGRQRFLHVEIPISPRPRPKAKTTTTTKTTATKVAATPITTTTVTSAYREKPPTQTSPRSRYRSSGTPRAAAALISSLPRALKEKLYRHETIEILDAVVIPYSKKKERACQEQASSLKPCQGHNKQGSSRNLTSYARKPSSSSASLSEATRRRTLIVSSDEDSGLEHQSDEDHEEEEGLNMSSLLRNTIRVAQKRSRQTKSPTQGKSKAASSGRSNHRNINKLRKRLLEEVELDEDAGIGEFYS